MLIRRCLPERMCPALRCPPGLGVAGGVANDHWSSCTVAVGQIIIIIVIATADLCKNPKTWGPDQSALSGGMQQS
jgi:hypothetical protein